MAMATSSAAVGSATGHTVAPTAHLQFQESFNLKRSYLFFPLSKCGALSTSSTKHCSPRRTQRRPKSILPVRAVASTQESTENESITKTTKYHFLVANAKFMLDEEEHFQELMRERLRNFEERKREQDFWLVIEPKFLENFPDITKRLRRPAVALVSTDELWITFMKLRLDRVLRGEIEAETLAEALKSDSVDLSFEKPQTWTAPYTKYTGSWWIPFLPPQEH